MSKENIEIPEPEAEKIVKNKLSKTIKINYVCMCFFALLTGADFAVIIPTLWDRLHIDFQSSGSFMGLVISSYSASGVLCGLIMGQLSDQINKTKPFYLLGIGFSIFGHLLYFIGLNKYVILVARAISGVGVGASTVALAYIARTTTEKQRTSVISLVMACRQMGLMFGPAFNIFLRKANFVLFDKFTVDRKSAPGLFMSSMWSLVLFIFIIFYKEKGLEEEKKPQNNDENVEFLEKKKLTFSEYKKEFFRAEIFLLLGATFFTYFNQTSLETIVTPFTEMMFGWTELQNSILFCAGGCVIIFSYVLIRLINIKLRDRAVLLAGNVSILLGLLIGCVFITFVQQPPQAPLQISLYKQSSIRNESLNSEASLNGTFFNFKRVVFVSNSSSVEKPTYDYRLFPAFVVFVVFDVLGLPAIAISSASLFTKLIDDKVQGLGQGIQRGVLGVGTIFGPLFAGPFVQKPIYILWCTLGIIFILLIFVLVNFRKLKPNTRVAIRLKLVEPPSAAKAVPIGKKRRPGRPKLCTKALSR